MKILVTGGCGFIGSNFIRHLSAARPESRLVNIDLLTYAGNMENLDGIQCDFVRADIADSDAMESLFSRNQFDAVVNFAAESHVDRSLKGASQFVDTNIKGTAVLLEAARRHQVGTFLQVSTDEVYGSAPEMETFKEDSPLHPNNPYAATKAAAELLVLSYFRSFGMNVIITRSSNNYGPYQHPEKFVPLFVTNALEGKECPLYGDGMNVRDWLFVEDNCRGILYALESGRKGEAYNLGGQHEKTNLSVALAILEATGRPSSLIKMVQDRPGHDYRYSLDINKVSFELGWAPKVSFEEGLKRTIEFYRGHPEWVAHVKSGEYQKYYEEHYGRKV